jgi:hypothetical protein
VKQFWTAEELPEETIASDMEQAFPEYQERAYVAG